MDGYVSKPINSRDLELAIAKAMNLTSSASGWVNAAVRQGIPSARPLLDCTFMLEQLGGDEKLMQEVIDIFIDQAPTHIETLRRALTQGDAELVEGTAHCMKGELGYLGISEVTQKARILEELGRKRDLEQAEEAFASFEAEIAGIVTAMKETKSENLIAKDGL